jgi:hypothetical protein
VPNLERPGQRQIQPRLNVIRQLAVIDAARELEIPLDGLCRLRPLRRLRQDRCDDPDDSKIVRNLFSVPSAGASKLNLARR